jgi:beta-1,4-N-acetylglucosaminyltransferase
MRNDVKICLAASSGGHLAQLLTMQRIWRDCPRFFVTTTDLVRNKLTSHGNVYCVGESNRQHPFRVARSFLRCVDVLLRERPDIIISTGASVGFICCMIGKLMGAQVIWIDSITNVTRLSLSGRMVRHIADLFLVQWPELAERYSHVEYVGAVI